MASTYEHRRHLLWKQRAEQIQTSAWDRVGSETHLRVTFTWVADRPDIHIARVLDPPRW